MFWVEGNTPFGIHVDNKRTEEFRGRHLAKRGGKKSYQGYVLFLRESFEKESE